jgi:hypothetical protein
MRLAAPTDPDQHRPFRIGDGPSQSGARLGGRAPVLDAMPLLAPASQYVPMNDGLQSDHRIVAVRHGEAVRGDSILAILGCGPNGAALSQLRR